MTAVPPRPAAPDACTCGHFGLSANFHMTPCPIKVAHLARLAAPDATAGDGLRSAIARWLWNDRWNDGDQDPDPANAAMPWDEAHPVQQELMRERAENLLALPALRDVLAAAARDAEAVAKVEEAHSWQCDCTADDPCRIRRALDGA